MTQTPPPAGPLYELGYQTAARHGNAPTLVLLAVIFNYVVAVLDLLYCLGSIGFGAFFYFTIASAGSLPTTTSATTTSAPSPPFPGPWFALIYAIPAIPSVVAATLKIIGATKLRRRSHGAFGWGIAAGVVGCTQLWCGVVCMPACVVPLAAGVFTIVILCLDHVRAYLAAPPQTIPGAFPV